MNDLQDYTNKLVEFTDTDGSIILGKVSQDRGMYIMVNLISGKAKDSDIFNPNLGIRLMDKNEVKVIE